MGAEATVCVGDLVASLMIAAGVAVAVKDHAIRAPHTNMNVNGAREAQL